MVPLIFNADVVEVLDVVKVDTNLPQSCIRLVAQEIVNWDSVLQVEGKRVDVVVYDEDVVQGDFAGG